ncbi:aspartyl protease family protein [Ilyomonas limi]|uniref:aspartyl protease family protein n=1 Tax=Ilyomonas limi TaxID=2575867 RepID=UPI001484F469|nr:aspartyl protease family protein [Ilyomonas limi]
MIAWICMLPVRSLTQQNAEPIGPARHITTVPFTMLTGGIVIIRATLDSLPDSLNFILDTGSGGISLDSTTCSTLGIKLQHSNRTIRGIAGIKTVDFAYGHTMNLPDLSVEKLDFHVNDYDILTSVYGVKIDGIIGYSFFRRYIIKIDYDKMQMEVLTPGAIKYPRGGTLLKPQFSTLAMQRLYVKDRVGITAKFYYDMGAGLCMLLSKSFVTDSMFLNTKKKMFETQAQGLGGKAEMSLTIIKEIRLGPYRFRKVPTYIFNDEYNATSYPASGGLIGNDILRRFNVVLNYGKQEIFIKPNNRYRDSFDYAYTGLGIYLINNEVTVLDIMKGSPAEKAGFQEGDVVIGMNKNFSGNIQVYKAMLQTINTTISVMVRDKNGELMKRQLKVQSIL